MRPFGKATTSSRLRNTLLVYCIELRMCVCVLCCAHTYNCSAFIYGVHGASIGRRDDDDDDDVNEWLCSIAAMQTTPLSVL